MMIQVSVEQSGNLFDPDDEFYGIEIVRKQKYATEGCLDLSELKFVGMTVAVDENVDAGVEPFHSNWMWKQDRSG